MSLLPRRTLLLLPLLLPRPARSEKPELPASFRKILESAPAVTLLSLDPDGRGSRPGQAEKKADNAAEPFHGYPVLGKVRVSGKDRAALLRAFYASVAEGGSPALCFEPGHGLRAVSKGRTVEIVLCFACSQYKLYENGKFSYGGALGKLPAVFNDLLKRNRILISP